MTESERAPDPEELAEALAAEQRAERAEHLAHIERDQQVDDRLAETLAETRDRNAEPKEIAVTTTDVTTESATARRIHRRPI